MREKISSGELGHGYEVSSAGLMAMEGSPASAMSIEIAAENGLDLESHRSRQLSENILFGADLVIGMQPSHLFPLESLRGSVKPQFHILGEFCCNAPESVPGIPDPFGGNREAYEQAFATIAHCVEGLVEFLKIKEETDGGKHRK